MSIFQKSDVHLYCLSLQTNLEIKEHFALHNLAPKNANERHRRDQFSAAWDWFLLNEFQGYV